VAGHSSDIMALPTSQKNDLGQAFRQFESCSDGLTLHRTAKFFFPAQKNWQPPVDILPLDELEIKLPLIKEFFRRCQAEFPGQGSPEPKPYEIAAMLHFDIAELRRHLAQPSISNSVWTGLNNIAPLLKRCLAKRVTAEDEAQATRSATASRASSISSRGSKRQSTSSGTQKSGKRPYDASEDDDGSAKQDAHGGDDVNDRDYHDSSPIIKAGKVSRNRNEKAKRLDLDDFRCIVCETDSPAVCHIVPFCVNSRTGDKNKWGIWLRRSMDFYEEASAPVDGVLLGQAFISTEPGVSDRHWNMVSLNPQLHTWWGQARWGFKCLGITLEGPAPRVGHVKLKLQFHWMPRRATDSKVATLGLSLTDFKSAFDGNWGDPTRKPLVCMTYPGTGRFIETGDIFYVQVPTSDCSKMELAFQIQWAVLRIAAIAGGAEALNYLPDEPEDDDIEQYYALTHTSIEQSYVPHDAIAALGSSAPQHATDDTEPQKPKTPPA
jgi:hypothetical protein